MARDIVMRLAVKFIDRCRSRVVILSSLLLWTLLPSFAFGQSQCLDIFTKNSNELVLERLSNVPELKALVSIMLNDPDIPANVKRVLRVSLIDERATVRQLTKYLRESLNLPDNAGAIARLYFRNFRKMEIESERLTFNEEIHARMQNSPVLGRSTEVFVPQRPFSTHTNDLIKLVHELAHVRFNAFLEKNINALYLRFSSHLFRKRADGMIEIHPQLFDFLSERYAHQLEAEVYFATVGRYYTPRYSRYDELTAMTYNDFVVSFIIKNYGLTDPAVLALAPYSLGQILRGEPFRSESE